LLVRLIRFGILNSLLLLSAFTSGTLQRPCQQYGKHLNYMIYKDKIVNG